MGKPTFCQYKLFVSCMCHGLPCKMLGLLYDTINFSLPLTDSFLTRSLSLRLEHQSAPRDRLTQTKPTYRGLMRFSGRLGKVLGPCSLRRSSWKTFTTSFNSSPSDYPWLKRGTPESGMGP